MNQALLTALAAIGIAQCAKLPLQLSRTGHWHVRITGSGGMPSAHSSGVSALASYTAVRYGVRSPEFALASMLGIIVMYDAMNIRRHAGEIAMLVNDLDANVEQLNGRHIRHHYDHTQHQEKLEESLGHQPEEVAAGAAIGTAIGIASALLRRSKH